MPPPVEGARYFRTIAESARKLVRQALIEASAAGRAAAVLAAIEVIGTNLVGLYDAEFAHQRGIDGTLERGLAAIECRKGCSFCCQLRVTATMLEVTRIADSLDDERRSVVLSTAEADADLDERQRLARSVSCPLLLEGACSTDEMRPLTRRALLSRSATLCERQLEGGTMAEKSALVPSPDTPRRISASLINGQIAALRDLGLASNPVEPSSTLAALEREPTLFLRWLSREDVFARAFSARARAAHRPGVAP